MFNQREVIDYFDRLFHPRAISVIGASDNPVRGSIGLYIEGFAEDEGRSLYGIYVYPSVEKAGRVLSNLYRYTQSLGRLNDQVL